jgi:MYXO-CTERM domain-containing protein
MGFRFGDGTNWNYGWIEVTWTWGGSPQNSSFQILAAAYESNVGAAIVTPSGVVPLPGAAGLAAVGLVGLRGRRRR